MKRSHKKLDPNIKALGAAIRALTPQTPKMRRATLEYLWDRFVVHPPKPDAKEGE